MQEINLLQNKVKDQTLSFERRNRLVITLFTLLLILEVLGAGGLYVLTKATQNQTQSVQQKNQQTQASLDASQKDLNLAKGLQAQLKNVRVLLNNHIYWSSFYDTLASLTTKKIQYSSIAGGATDDKIRLEGLGASYTDIGKLILSLSTSDNFSNVKLSSIGSSEGKTFGFTFSLSLNVSPKLFLKN